VNKIERRLKKMEKNKCLRCGHEWISRIETRAKSCPACKSFRWSIPKGGKPEEKKEDDKGNQ